VHLLTFFEIRSAANRVNDSVSLICFITSSFRQTPFAARGSVAKRD